LEGRAEGYDVRRKLGVEPAAKLEDKRSGESWKVGPKAHAEDWPPMRVRGWLEGTAGRYLGPRKSWRLVEGEAERFITGASW